MYKRDQSDDSANHSPRNGLAHMHNGICQCGINSPSLSRGGTASSWKVDHSAGLQLGLYSKIQQLDLNSVLAVSAVFVPSFKYILLTSLQNQL